MTSVGIKCIPGSACLVVHMTSRVVLELLMRLQKEVLSVAEASENLSIAVEVVELVVGKYCISALPLSKVKLSHKGILGEW